MHSPFLPHPPTPSPKAKGRSPSPIGEGFREGSTYKTFNTLYVSVY